jgi:hypothetical protein
MTLQESLAKRRDDAKTRAFAQRRQANLVRIWHTTLLYLVPIFAFLGSTTLLSGVVTTGEFNYVPVAGACSLMAGVLSIVLGVQDLEAIAERREEAAAKYDHLWQDIEDAMDPQTPPSPAKVNSFKQRMQQISEDYPSAHPWIYDRAEDAVAKGKSH